MLGFWAIGLSLILSGGYLLYRQIKTDVLNKTRQGASIGILILDLLFGLSPLYLWVAMLVVGAFFIGKALNIIG